MCYQILLFRIEYDPLIVGIVEPPIPQPLPPDFQVRPFAKKIFVYADDANLLIKCEVGTFLTLTRILTDYKTLSGLECNIEKTAVMQVGEKSPPDAGILELGFSFVDKLTILGTIINSDSGCQEENATIIYDKVRKQVRYWTRFCLSLPGRIMIAKTMMYSQLNYLGSFLPFKRAQLTPIEHLIENYVRGNLRISTERIFSEVKTGGLGLFKIESFLNAQKCSWVKKVSNLNDLWKLKLFTGSGYTAYNLRSSFFDETEAPVLISLARSWEIFYFGFTAKNENSREAFVFDNPLFKLNEHTKLPKQKNIRKQIF